MRTLKSLLLVLSIVSLGGIPLRAAVQASGQEVTIIAGKVTDESGAALGGVTIHVEDAGLSDVVTEPDGSYKFVVMGQKEAQLRFSRKGYQKLTRTLRLPGGQVQVDVRLHAAQVQIRMTRFQSQHSIEGKVLGLDEHSYGAYKVVAYVLTNK